MLMQAKELTTVLGWLAEQGIRLVVDGLGQSYSKLDYLDEGVFVGAKLSRQTSRDLLGLADTSGLLEHMLALAAERHLCVYAVGLESEEQVRQARKAGIDCGQGFYWQAASPWPPA